MVPLLVISIVVAGAATTYFAVKYRDFRKFLAGAFFVSGGIQFYFWQVGVDVPLYNTGLVQTPELSLVRSLTHFALFAVTFYFGFVWKSKKK